MDQSWLSVASELAADFPEMGDAPGEKQSLTQDHSELLRRASLARSVDRGLYEAVLIKDLNPSPPAFEELGKLPGFEAVPYEKDTYWVRDSVRSKAAAEWQGRAGEGQEWSRRIAEYYQSCTTLQPLARLEALVRSKDSSAAAVFEQQFRAADRRFDLATMSSLLEIVKGNLHLASSDLYDVWLRSLRLYGARALFRQEFHQTVAYFQRPRVQRQFRRFLRSKTRWLFHVHGPGGLGKTMMLRWLISHRLIQRRMSTYCVKLDFDDYSLAAIAQDSWLLALPMAEQLDPQVSITEFKSLATSLSTYSPLLRGTPAEEIYAPSDQAEFSTSLSFSVAAGPNYWPQLYRAFDSIPKDARIVLFLDTLEQVSQFYPGAIMDVLGHLDELHTKAPGLRVVLAGRYALGLEQVPEFRKLYGKVTLYSRLRRFTDSDALRFIKLQSPDLDDPRCKAIRDRGAGNPFKLGMMTELVAAEPDISETEIRGPKFDEVDLAYLIHRVVKRIPEKGQLPVRWVVRYGAIPRRLTREFMEKVLLKPLERALSGAVAAVGDDLVDEAITQGLWKADPFFKLDAREVWRQLAQYSSKHSWIFVDQEDSGRASLHPEVVLPARRLLSKQRIFAQLQKAALEFFEEKQSPIDILFHKLQSGSTTVFADWEELLRSTALRRDPRKWRRYAEELLEEDFSDAPPQAKALAHWQASEAIAAQSNWSYLLPPLDQKSALDHLFQAHKLQLANSFSIVPPSVLLVADAVKEFQEGGKAAVNAIERLETCRNTDSEGRARILQHVAEMLYRLNSDRSEEVFEEALRVAEAQMTPDVPPRILHERLGYRYARRGLWTAASQHYQRALFLTRQEGFEDRLESIEVALIELELSTGRYAAARTMIEQRMPPTHRRADLRVRLELAVLRPQRALDLLAQWPVGTGRLEAQRLQLTGEALGQQGRLSDAVNAFQQAGRLCDSVGDIAGVDRATGSELMMYVYSAGNFTRASAILEKPLRTGFQSPTLGVQWLLAQCWLAYGTGSREDLTRALASFPDNSSQERAYRLLIGISFGAYPREALQELLSVVGTIQPVTARLTLLEPLVLSKRWPELERNEADEVVNAFDCQPDGEEERALFALALAELERVVGLGEAAVRRLQEGVPKPLSDHSDAAIHYVARLALEARLRSEGQFVAVDVEQSSLFDSLSSLPLPLPAAAARILVAEMAISSGNLDLAETLAEQAKGLLSLEGIATKFSQDHAAIVETLKRLQSRPLPSPPFEASDLEIPASPTSSAPGAEATEPNEMTARDSEEEIEAALAAIGAKLTLRTIALHEGKFRLFDPSMKFAFHSPSTPFLSLVANAQKDFMGELLAKQVVENWSGVATELAIALELPDYDPGKPRRLLLDTSAGLARLPWEFMTGLDVDRPTLVRYPALAVQEPDTKFSSLNRFLRPLTYFSELSRASRLRPDPDSPRTPISSGSLQMLLVSPEAEHLRGISGFGYSNLREIYGRFQLTLVTDTKQLEMELAARDYDLIVIPSRFTFLSHANEPVLQTLGLRARSLSSMLRRQPIVILDTPLPSNPEEAILQLFARNDFAFELQRSGQVRAVIATGLGQSQDVVHLHQMLEDSLMDSATLVETMDRIRGGGGPGAYVLATALPYLGTALFTKQPYYALGTGGGRGS